MSNIYLISPEKISVDVFEKDLIEILKTGLVKVFQLRLKGYDDICEIENISLRLFEICQNYNCIFLVNDYLEIALKHKFNGVHLGQEDLLNNLDKINNLPSNFILGISCHDSLKLAFDAEKIGASYVAFGAFFATKTKKTKFQPKPEIIKEFNLKSSLPVVAIGGIDNNNCQELVKNGADFLAVISYIWQSKNPIKSLKLLHQNLTK